MTKKKQGNNKGITGNNGNSQPVANVVSAKANKSGVFTDNKGVTWAKIQEAGRKYIPKGTFAGAGSMLGGFVGGPAGVAIGSALGRGLAAATGFGAYHIKSNSLVSSSQKIFEGEPIPTFAPTKFGYRMQHREFVTDISAAGGANFTNYSFSLNPGLDSLFTWLNGVAACHDQWILHGCIVDLVSTCSDYSSAGAMGSVIVAADYDSNDAPYGNKIEMENAQFSVSGKPSKNLQLIIECDKSVTQYYIKNVRTASVSDDLARYDHCTIQVATVGLPISSGNIMEMWITYDIEFLKPQIASTVGSYDFFDLDNTISTSNYFAGLIGGTEQPDKTRKMGGYITTSTYYFPSRAPIGSKYMVEYAVKGASTVLTTALTMTYSGCAIYTPSVSGTTSYKPVGGSTTDATYFNLWIQVTGSNASFTISGGTLPTSITDGMLNVVRLDL